MKSPISPLKSIDKRDLRVAFFHRKRRQHAHFSIEFIFQEVRRALADRIRAEVVVSPYLSNGVVRRLLNTAHASRHQADVNHITGDTNYLAMGLQHRRNVLTIHDCSYLDRTQGIRRAILRHFWVVRPVRCSKFVTTVSSETKRVVLANTGCDPDKVRVIYNPISQSFRFSPARAMPDAPRILQIGTAINKNIERLAAALQGIPCSLIIIGKLSESQKQALATHQIHYENLFELSQQQVVEQYELADLVAFVSTVEGFGMPIIEANLVGRPVVTSSVSSMPEIAADAAQLVDPYDVASIRSGFQQVIARPSLRADLVQRGLENGKRFQVEQVAEEYFKLYCEIAYDILQPQGTL